MSTTAKLDLSPLSPMKRIRAELLFRYLQFRDSYEYHTPDRAIDRLSFILESLQDSKNTTKIITKKVGKYKVEVFYQAGLIRGFNKPVHDLIINLTAYGRHSYKFGLRGIEGSFGVLGKSLLVLDIHGPFYVFEFDKYVPDSVPVDKVEIFGKAYHQMMGINIAYNWVKASIA